MPTTFEYRPLETKSHIRLLEVISAPDDSPIQCMVIDVDLDNIMLPDGYHALSYVWGDPEIPKVPLKLAYAPPENTNVSSVSSDDTVWGEVEITPSLDSALRNLGFCDDGRRFIWADAVCINQGDLVEKQHQLLRMGDIYSYSSVVLVWLGLPHEADDPALETSLSHDDILVGGMQWLTRCWELSTAKLQEWREYDTEEFQQLLAPTEAEMYGMIVLYGRPWYSRIWIIQEIVRAEDVVVCCGQHAMRLMPLLGAAYMVYKILERRGHPEVLGRPLRAINLGQTRVLFSGSEYREKLLHDRVFAALSTSTTYKATIYCDRLYGLLGLIGDVDGHPALTPDYTKPKADFLLDLAQYLAQASGTAGFLCACGGDRGGLPSWVPTWEVPTSRGPYLPTERARSYSTLSLSGCGRLLHVNHLPLGRICHVERVECGTMDDVSLRKRLLDVENAIAAALAPVQQHAADAEQSKTPFGRLFFGSFFVSVQIARYLELYRTWIFHSTWPRSLKQPSEGQASDELRMLKSLKGWLGDGQDVFVTTAGHVGMVKQNAEENDVVCLVPGSRTPFFLREKGEYFELLGTCFVEGYHNLEEDQHYQKLDNGILESITIG